MNTKLYHGKIWLKSGGHPIAVSVGATSNQSAKKAIEAQYSGQIRKWAKQI